MPTPAAEDASADLTPFPDPANFAILQDVYLLLSRIALVQQGQATNGASASLTNDAQLPNPLNLTPLDVKDLTAAVYPLRQKIEKAREAVTGMVDTERSIEEQETEMQDLETRVEALKGRLALLADIAGKGLEHNDDQAMKGVEEHRPR